jgi:hypothetical protein
MGGSVLPRPACDRLGLQLRRECRPDSSRYQRHVRKLCARAPAALCRDLHQVDFRRRCHHAALSHHRLSRGAGHRLCQRALAAVDAAAHHAAVLDQPADPHLRADRGAAHRRLRQFHTGMALGPGELADDAGGFAAAWRFHAPSAALQQFCRGNGARLCASAFHGAAALRGTRSARQISNRSESRPRRRSSAHAVLNRCAARAAGHHLRHHHHIRARAGRLSHSGSSRRPGQPDDRQRHRAPIQEGQ